MEKKCFEIRIEEIYGIQAEIEDLVRKCGPAMTYSEPVAHKVRKVAGQLLAAMDKIINVGRDLNAITSCMLDVADIAQADNRDLGQVPHILAWAGWTCDLTSDILDAVDGLLRAGHDLIGSSHNVHNLKAQSASAAAQPERRFAAMDNDENSVRFLSGREDLNPTMWFRIRFRQALIPVELGGLYLIALEAVAGRWPKAIEAD